MIYITVLFIFVVSLVLLKLFFNNYGLARKIQGPTASFLVVFMTRVQAFSYFRSCAQRFKGAYRLFGFGNVFIMVMRAREAEILLSSSAHSRKTYIYKIVRGFFGQSTFTSNGEQWKRQRKMLTPTLHFEILANFSRNLSEESEKAVERLRHGFPVQNVSEFVTDYTLAASYRSLMGVELYDKQEVKEYLENNPKIDDLFAERASRPPLHNDLVHRLGLEWFEKKLLEPMKRFTRNTIEKRRKVLNKSDVIRSVNWVKQRHALLDTLLLNEAMGKISPEVVQNEVDLFLWAAHQTTAVSISFVLMLLANHPEVQRGVYEEIRETVKKNNGAHLSMAQLGELNYLDRVIKEGLRLYPPVPAISRQLSEEMTLDDGTTIPAEKSVFLQIFDLHRDEAVFPDPEKFDPDRFLPENCRSRSPFAYLPFSAGPRNCIGKKFALAIIKTLVKDMVLNFKLICVTKQEDIRFTSSNVLRTIDPILVAFEKREYPQPGQGTNEEKKVPIYKPELLESKEIRSR